MKAFAFLSLATTAVAQNFWIQAPVLDQKVVPGGDLVIEVQSQDAASPYTDIAAAIGIQPYPEYSSGVNLGQFLLYQGNWSIEGFAYPQGGLYTNISVNVPTELPLGEALLSVALFQSLNNPTLQTVSTNVTVVANS